MAESIITEEMVEKARDAYHESLCCDQPKDVAAPMRAALLAVLPDIEEAILARKAAR